MLPGGIRFHPGCLRLKHPDIRGLPECYICSTIRDICGMPPGKICLLSFPYSNPKPLKHLEKKEDKSFIKVDAFVMTLIAMLIFALYILFTTLIG
jgi:hypothetical protein